MYIAYEFSSMKVLAAHHIGGPIARFRSLHVIAINSAETAIHSSYYKLSP